MKNPILPPVLYKYLKASLSATDVRIPFLEADRLLRYTQQTSFNDAYEALTVWDIENIDDETIQKVFVGIPLPNQEMLPEKREDLRKMKFQYVKENLKVDPQHYLEMLTRLARENAVRHTGVLSLSSLWNSELMWAHYGENEGICVGLDTTHEFFRHDLDNLVYKVEYSPNRKKAHPSILRNFGLAEFLYENKSDNWRYEDEYRIVRSLLNATETYENDAKGNPIYLFEVPAEAISEVYLGPLASPDISDKVLEWGKSNLHVSIYKTALSSKGYCMDRTKI